jgi:hypothetical protein
VRKLVGAKRKSRFAGLALCPASGGAHALCDYNYLIPAKFIGFLGKFPLLFTALSIIF